MSVALDIIELKQLLEEPTKEFIRSVRANFADEELPTTTVLKQSESGEFEEIVVTHPSMLLEDYPSTGIFREAATQVVNNLPKQELQPINDHYSGKAYDFTDLLEIEFRTLAHAVVDYEGKLEYSKSSFESAFQGFVSSDKLGVIVPILNFEGDFPDIEIQPLEYGLDKGVPTRVGISRLSVAELNGIYSSETGVGSPIYEENSISSTVGYDFPISDWTHKIDLRFSASISGIGLSLPEIVDQNQESSIEKVQRLLTALRLFKPSYDIGVKQYYHVGYHWLYEREDVANVLGSSLSTEVLVPTTAPYSLSESEADDFASFWERYQDEIKPTDNELFSSQIRRFNSTYLKSTLEDRIVDAVIAFESLLLKDLGTQSSITFRLVLRASLLLEPRSEYDRDFLQTFFKNVYFARGEIVHKDRNLESILDDRRFKGFEEPVTPLSFSILCRDLLAQTICGYMDIHIEHGLNITQTNQKIDQSILNMPPIDFTSD